MHPTLHKIKHFITRQDQMSEAFFLNLVMAFSGGFQDAYTYIVRGHVFANAQTGNVVLLSTYAFQGEWALIPRYLFPILAFALGVFVAEHIQHAFTRSHRIHWRQVSVIVEALIMIAVGFLGPALNLLANALVSFACAVQVQSFRTVDGYSYASTMCIGNIRSGTEAFSEWIRDRQEDHRRRVLVYYGVIVVFGLGAGIGAMLSASIGQRAIWFTSVPLILGFVLMDLDRLDQM